MILFEGYIKFSFSEIKDILKNNEITKFDFYTIEYYYDDTNIWYNIGIILNNNYEKYDGIFLRLVYNNKYLFIRPRRITTKRLYESINKKQTKCYSRFKFDYNLQKYIGEFSICFYREYLFFTISEKYLNSNLYDENYCKNLITLKEDANIYNIEEIQKLKQGDRILKLNY